MAKPKPKPSTSAKSSNVLTPATTSTSQLRGKETSLRTPTTIMEFRRLGHAFLAGSKFKKGDVVYVVASTTEPLRRIQETFATLAEAEDAIRRGVQPARGWSPAEARSRVIYQVTVPDADELSQLVIGDHEYTDLDGDDVRMFRSKTLGDIASVEVHVTLKTGECEVFRPSGVPDAIFISRGAYELFVFPAYQSAFGPKYVQALRKVVLG